MSFSLNHIAAPSSQSDGYFHVISYSPNQSSAGGGGAPPPNEDPEAGGSEPPSNPDGEERLWQVSTGHCFAGFSYFLDERNLIKIEGLESGFKTEPGEKIYLEFDVSTYLQVTGARVRHSKVGKDSPDFESTELDVETWADFPSMFRIAPKDEIDSETGFVKKRAEGKRQTKAYILLATRSDDDLTNLLKADGGDGADGGGENSENYSIVQHFDSNIIMMISQVSGVPVVFPMPWINSLESTLRSKEN